MASFCTSAADGIRNQNGKRERSDQDEDQEFMPLSKRINNIHLSPERVPGPNPGFSNPNYNQPLPPRPPIVPPEIPVATSSNPVNINTVPGNYQIPEGGGTTNTNNHFQDNIEYRPSLNQIANPHYYEANRALFNLYIERQLRNNLIPHPNVIGRPPNLGGSSTSM